MATLSAVVAALVTAGVFVAFGSIGGGSRDSVGTGLNRQNAAGTLDIQSILTKAEPSVVTIRTTTSASRGVFGGAGTGVVISDDGLILTNAHVVGSNTNMRVVAADGTERSATLVGSRPDNDVALVRVDDPEAMVPAELGQSDEVRVGDKVVAIGNALNLGGTPSVTEGIVSAKDRTIQAPNLTLPNLIQTDAAINPGNSGGPLLNAAGQVIAINTAIISDAQNIGFAIPIDSIKPLIDELRSGRGTITPDTAYLGVSTTSVADTNRSTLDRYQVTASQGAFVQEVDQGSGADAAGIQPGDVIVAIDGQAVTSTSDVGAWVRTKSSGDEVVVEYQRRGQPGTTTATLQSRREAGG